MMEDGGEAGGGTSSTAPGTLEKRGHARVVREVVRESKGKVKGGLIYIEPLHGEGRTEN